MNLEDELRSAMRREDPSPGFAQRVVAHARSSRPPKQAGHRMIWSAALAAMLAVGFTGVYEYRQMKAEKATRDALMALRIAAEKLNVTRDKAMRREN